MATSEAVQKRTKASLVHTRAIIRDKFRQLRNELSREERDAKIKYSPITSTITKYMESQNLSTKNEGGQGEDNEIEQRIIKNEAKDQFEAAENENKYEVKLKKAEPEEMLKYQTTRQRRRRRRTQRVKLSRKGKYSLPSLAHLARSIESVRNDEQADKSEWIDTISNVPTVSSAVISNLKRAVLSCMSGRRRSDINVINECDDVDMMNANKRPIRYRTTDSEQSSVKQKPKRRVVSESNDGDRDDDDDEYVNAEDEPPKSSEIMYKKLERIRKMVEASKQQLRERVARDRELHLRRVKSVGDLANASSSSLSSASASSSSKEIISPQDYDEFGVYKGIRKSKRGKHRLSKSNLQTSLQRLNSPKKKRARLSNISPASSRLTSSDDSLHQLKECGRKNRISPIKGGTLTKRSTSKSLEKEFIPYTTNIAYEYYDDPNEICDRLRLLVMSKVAGNTNHDQEINSIIEELREAGTII